MVAATVKFSQGTKVGTASQAFLGIAGQVVTVSNGDDTGVSTHLYELLSAPTNSSLIPGTLGSGTTATFTPDVTGSYRVRLTVTGGSVQSAGTSVFGIPNSRGWVVPAFGGRSGEHNFDGQTRGWAGTSAVPMMDVILGDTEDALNNNGTDPVGGKATFTLSASRELKRITLTDATYYNIRYHGMCLTRSTGQMSPFDYTLCVNVSGGVASLGDTPTGLGIAPSQGAIGFSCSGLDVIATVYGGPTGTEFRGNFTIELSGTEADQLPPGWTPASSVRCLTYWSARTGVTFNGFNQVTSWSGQIGSVVATASTAWPTYVANYFGAGLHAVHFTQSASNKMVVANLTHAVSDYQCIAVFDQVSRDSDGYLFDSTSGRLIFSPDRTSNSLAYSDGSFHQVGSTSSTGLQKVGWVLQSGNGSIRKNGVKVSSSSLPYTQVAIGGTTKLGSSISGTTSGLFDGYLAEFVIFEGTNDLDMFQTELYFRLLYGV